MNPYDAYMAMIAKMASKEDPSKTLEKVVHAMPAPVEKALSNEKVREIVDPTKKPLYQISDYVTKHKGDMARSAGSNVLYGMLSNPRGNGPVSLTGSSVGGVIDGLLFKPVVDAGIGLVGKGMHAISRLKSEQ